MFSKTDRLNPRSPPAEPMSSSSVKSLPTHQSYIRTTAKPQKPCSYGNFDIILQENTPNRLSCYETSRKRAPFARQLPMIKEQRESLYQSDSKSMKPLSSNSQLSCTSKRISTEEKKILLPKSVFYHEAKKQSSSDNPRSDTQLNSACSTESNMGSSSYKELASQKQATPKGKSSLKSINAPLKFLDIKPDDPYFPRPYFSQRSIQNTTEIPELTEIKQKPLTSDPGRVRSESDFTQDFKKKDQMSNYSATSNRSTVYSENSERQIQEHKPKTPNFAQSKISSAQEYMLDKNIYEFGGSQARQQQLALWQQQVETPSCCLCMSFGKPATAEASATLGISYQNPPNMFGPHPW